MKTTSKKTSKAAASPAAIEKAEAEDESPRVRKTRVKADVKKPAAAAATPAVKAVKKSSTADKTAAPKSPAAAKTSKPVRAKRSAAPKKPAETASAGSTSPVKVKRKPAKAALSESPAAAAVDKISRVDKLLATPELPPLERENRARLQMQTPTRLYFYWSVRRDPWAVLRKAFGGDTGSYTLVLKLVELRTGAEEIYRADAEGNWWFDVGPDGQYRAEIGFHAPNRPYFRIVYSNVVETPRRKPSPRKAAESNWTVTADQFARVLDLAGFTRDAVDVAIAGDDPPLAAAATRSALGRLVGGSGKDLRNVDDADIRFALLAIAEGQTLDQLRWKVSEELFAYLQAHKISIDEGRARGVLREHFDIEEFDLETEETGPAVYGSSLLNFPRTRRTRQRSATPYASASSHSFLRSFGG